MDKAVAAPKDRSTPPAARQQPHPFREGFLRLNKQAGFLAPGSSSFRVFPFARGGQ